MPGAEGSPAGWSGILGRAVYQWVPARGYDGG